LSILNTELILNLKTQENVSLFFKIARCLQKSCFDNKSTINVLFKAILLNFSLDLLKIDDILWLVEHLELTVNYNDRKQKTSMRFDQEISIENNFFLEKILPKIISIDKLTAIDLVKKLYRNENIAETQVLLRQIIIKEINWNRCGQLSRYLKELDQSELINRQFIQNLFFENFSRLALQLYGMWLSLFDLKYEDNRKFFFEVAIPVCFSELNHSGYFRTFIELSRANIDFSSIEGGLCFRNFLFPLAKKHNVCMWIEPFITTLNQQDPENVNFLNNIVNPVFVNWN